VGWPIAFDDVLAARERLRPHLPPTPLRPYPELDAVTGCRVLVKHEEKNPTGSFKARNGLSVVTALDADERRRGVVAATRGNHGLGLAWAGARLGVPVTICVPVGNSPLKNERIRALGARLIEEGADYDASVAVMERITRDEGLRRVHSTNDPLVIAGAATLTLEACEQAEAFDAMVVAVGGGSQAVGALTVLRHLRPAADVFGVQAEGASAIHDWWHTGRPLERPSADTFADGLATRKTYALTFPALQEGLADFVAVPDRAIAEALLLLRRITGTTPEGAGAAGLAGLLGLRDRFRGRTVVVVISGANIDPDILARLPGGVPVAPGPPRGL